MKAKEKGTDGALQIEGWRQIGRNIFCIPASALRDGKKNA
jgi:hypothetical protein